MTVEQFNDIKQRLAKWREERHLTYENQRIGLLGNLFEEISEYFRAKDDYERIDACMDICVFILNSFDINYKPLKPSSLDCYTFTEVVVYNTYSLVGARTDSLCIIEDDKDFERLEITLNCIIYGIEQISKDLGFDFYKCMLETIKEISSRTGKYDESIGKFIKDTSDEAKAKWYKANYENCRI